MARQIVSPYQHPAVAGLEERVRRLELQARRLEDHAASLEDRMASLGDRVASLADALHALARGLEDIPVTEPRQQAAAEAARRAHELLLVAEPD